MIKLNPPLPVRCVDSSSAHDFLIFNNTYHIIGIRRAAVYLLEYPNHGFNAARFENLPGEIARPSSPPSAEQPQDAQPMSTPYVEEAAFWADVQKELSKIRKDNRDVADVTHLLWYPKGSHDPYGDAVKVAALSMYVAIDVQKKRA